MSSPSLPQLVSLYKQLWRLHRSMPPALRFVGNKYIKDEFARHRNADPKFLTTFYKEWMTYKDTLEKQLAAAAERREQDVKFGKPLEKSKVEALSTDQLGQLYALKTEVDASSKNDKNSNK